MLTKLEIDFKIFGGVQAAIDAAGFEGWNESGSRSVSAGLGSVLFPKLGFSSFFSLFSQSWRSNAGASRHFVLPKERSSMKKYLPRLFASVAFLADGKIVESPKKFVSGTGGCSFTEEAVGGAFAPFYSSFLLGMLVLILRRRKE